jgi:type IV secretory pathway TrbD component
MDTFQQGLVEQRFHELDQQYGSGTTMLSLASGVLYLLVISAAVVMFGISTWWFAGFFIAVWLTMSYLDTALASVAKAQVHSRL